MFLASGPWKLNTSSFGSCASSSKAVSTYPVDCKQLKIHSSDELKKTNHIDNPFNKKELSKRYLVIGYEITIKPSDIKH